jgi:aminodeoxyfutalosine deaminase
MATVYFARWVLLPDGCVLDNGAVAVDGNLISSVGSRGSVKRTTGDRLVNLGNMLLMPGFINLHTHLEECFMRGLAPVPGETFSARLAKKNTRLKQVDAGEMASSARLCAREFLSHGITTVVDSSRREVSAPILAEEPIRSWVVHEIHAEDEEQESKAIDELVDRVAATPSGVGSAVGPYALFSLSPENHHKLSLSAHKTGCKWMTHIAESAEELQAFSEQTGDLYFQITRRKPWAYGKNATGPMYYALSNNLIPNGGICVNCNYVTGHELALLSAKHVSVAISALYTDACGANRFPLEIALDRRVNVCVCTESVADTDSTDLFDELHFLKRAYKHVPAATMLDWVTRNPAQALGVGEKLGSLTEGAFADIAGVKFHYDPKQALLEDLLMEEHPVGLVVVNGEEVVADY